LRRHHVRRQRHKLGGCAAQLRHFCQKRQRHDRGVRCLQQTAVAQKVSAPRCCAIRANGGGVTIGHYTTPLRHPGQRQRRHEIGDRRATAPHLRAATMPGLSLCHPWDCDNRERGAHGAAHCAILANGGTGTKGESTARRRPLANSVGSPQCERARSVAAPPYAATVAQIGRVCHTTTPSWPATAKTRHRRTNT
jgi:hypothetical protein